MIMEFLDFILIVTLKIVNTLISKELLQECMKLLEPTIVKAECRARSLELDVVLLLGEFDQLAMRRLRLPYDSHGAHIRSDCGVCQDATDIVLQLLA